VKNWAKENKKFPIGSRVQVTTRMQDFHFFSGKETGIVIRNNNEYLSIIVAFDEPMQYEGGYIQYRFNFNADDLKLLEKSSKKLIKLANEIREKIEPDGCEHESKIIYCNLCKPKNFCSECGREK
jgi:hypothetical protein